MNEKEIGELRRRLKPEKTSITRVRGCYVNEKKEILSEFDQSLGVLSEDEGERILALLRRTMSGTQGKNLVDISFATEQVASGEEHKLLMALRDGGTENEELLHELYHKIIESLDIEGSYLILVAADAYDVPFKGKDDIAFSEGSETVFRYILCSICPVKLTKTALTYHVNAGEFHSRATDWVVGSPEVGFLFPAFDGRATNLYGALYYCRNISLSQDAFIDAIFKTPAPMPAGEQKVNFESILGLSLGEEASMETVQAVRGQLVNMIQEHKESKEPEPLTVTKSTVKGVLASCGVSEEKVETFGQEYDQAFGQDMDLSPRNVVDPKQLEVKTPDVTIKVNPERWDLMETRVLGGAKYILIRAEEGVELNGVPIQIEE